MMLYRIDALSIATAMAFIGLGAGELSKAQSSELEELSLEEVIVTSRKRAENMQDTPISVTAFSARDLQTRQLGNASEIGPFTPNLIFEPSSPLSGLRNSSSIFIRGIGQADFLLTTDPGVGVYLDDVYMPRSVGGAIDLIDVERIEVMRGPQGTLFGRNTIGGAISITSKKPDETTRGELSLTTGSHERRDLQASTNGQLAKSLFSSVSLARFDRGGHIRRPLLGGSAGEDDGWGGRVALRWLPRNGLELNLSVDANHRNEDSCCQELIALNPAGFLTGFHNAVIAPSTGQPPATPALLQGDFTDGTSVRFPAEIQVQGATLSTQWQFNEVLMIKSITSWRDLESDFGVDIDHSPLTLTHSRILLDSSQFSQEFQLHGGGLGGRMQWLGGAYYSGETGTHRENVDFSILHFTSGGRVDNKSVALFGQSNYSATDRLSLTAGARWTRDEKSYTPEDNVVLENRALGTPFEAALPLPPGTPLTPPGLIGKQEVNEFTPYASVSYRWTDKVMPYVSYSEGFKSGGFVQRFFVPRTTVATYDPEYVKVLEAGVKTTAFDNRLRLNAAAFHTDYEDMQIGVFQDGAPLTQNAAGARIRGFELEAEALPRAGLKVALGVGYLDSGYTRIDPNVVTEVTVNSRLVNTPRWSINSGVSYVIAISSRWSLMPRIDWSWRSTNAQDARNTPEVIQDPRHLLNAGLTLEGLDGKWSAQLFGTNILDERYLISGAGTPDFQGVTVGTYGRPAEWGLKVMRKY
jgi:iron complex outermembrane recepter protein